MGRAARPVRAARDRPIPLNGDLAPVGGGKDVFDLDDQIGEAGVKFGHRRAQLVNAPLAAGGRQHTSGEPISGGQVKVVALPGSRLPFDERANLWMVRSFTAVPSASVRCNAFDVFASLPDHWICLSRDESSPAEEEAHDDRANEKCHAADHDAIVNRA